MNMKYRLLFCCRTIIKGFIIVELRTQMIGIKTYSMLRTQRIMPPNTSIIEMWYRKTRRVYTLVIHSGNIQFIITFREQTNIIAKSIHYNWLTDNHYLSIPDNWFDLVIHASCYWYNYKCQISNSSCSSRESSIHYNWVAIKTSHQHDRNYSERAVLTAERLLIIHIYYSA